VNFDEAAGGSYGSDGGGGGEMGAL